MYSTKYFDAKKKVPYTPRNKCPCGTEFSNWAGLKSYLWYVKSLANH